METGIICLLMGAAMVAQQPANNSADPIDPEVQYWKRIEAAENAKKAAFDAKKAALDAQAAEFQSRLGSITGQTTIKGEITEGDAPAKPEVLLLTVEAANTAAYNIAEKLEKLLGAEQQVLLVTSIDDLSLAQVNFYDFQRQQIDRRMVDAAKRLDDLGKPKAGVRTELVPPVAALGALIDVASKLGSYFLTDYKFGKVEVKLEDEAILYAAAAYLRPKLAAPKSIFIPQQLAGGEAEQLLKELDEPSTHYLSMVAKADVVRASVGQNPAAAEALAAADAAAKLWEGFVTALTTPPTPPAEPPIDRILRQKVVKRLLDAKTPILVLTHQNAGSYYTKKNLWTFLGGPPLYSAAAVTVSYVLLKGSDRQILASGTVPVHSRYTSVSNVMNRFQQPTPVAKSNPSRAPRTHQ
jgi:hypothetical protein